MTQFAIALPPPGGIRVVPTVQGIVAAREKRLPTSWIAKEPDRCGGDACIRDLRIPVWILVNYRRLGGSDEDLLRDYPALTPTDLEAAWAYSAANAEEIGRAIRENEAGEEGLVE
jgi:uncharacterized protein (DUF433 family)